MTRDDIIRMAQEAGLPETANEGVFIVNTDDLGRMLAAEREKVAHWMRTALYATGHGDSTEDLLRELAWQADERIAKAVAAEREACAKVCDDIDAEYEGEDVLATWCAAAIRARGQE